MGHGKYRVSDEYKNFYSYPVTWNRMTSDQQTDLIEKFYSFVPDDTTYHKPSNAGMKHTNYGKIKRRVHLPEPEPFSNRIKSPHPEKEPRLEEYVQLSQTNSNESIVIDEVID